ncbi:hypothetical protein RHS01_09860 [Rhizoctonia solani]|uniref:Homeobox domain-containing protein n=1 Tax=Rhizoctonia solani TaxID=456999 RepID=A0A8H7I361_9AGAM|nr:hypothetical protein RHS01_09860 [Rhizoctonia solani]
MPPKSKKRLAAQHREAKKAENVSSSTFVAVYSPPQYKPLDPSLQPYWDAFYENPYPNADERRILAERLAMRPNVIQQWFVMARRFTHAPDGNSNSYSDEIEALEVEGEHLEDLDNDDVSVKGTLYEYFYRGVIAQKSNPCTNLKRKGFDSEATVRDGEALQAEKSGLVGSKGSQYRGPRGPYTKQSQMTLLRRKTHARKYASPIESYFSTIPRATKKPRIKPPGSSNLSAIERVLADSEPEFEAGVPALEEGREIVVDQLHCENEQLAEGLKALKILLAKQARLLVQQINDTGINTQLPIELPPPNDLSVPQDANTEFPPPVLEDKAQVLEEGPTVQDAMEASTVEPVNVDMLEEADEDEQDKPFDVALDWHLKQLIGAEKKSKQPNPKRLIELTMLSDYNNLQKSYITAGCKLPSILASNQIAEAKFTPTPAKPSYQHKSWFACRLQVKAYHLVCVTLSRIIPSDPPIFSVIFTIFYGLFILCF